MKNLLQLLCFSLFCSACSSGEKQQQPKDFIEIDMVPLIEGEAEKVPLQEWAKSVRFIPLETNEEILIKGINYVYQCGDKFLLCQPERLSLFDREGKYLYDVGSLGQGPGEFVSIRGVVVHDGLIYVHEYANHFKIYDWEGKFMKKLVLPHKVRGLITYPGKEEMLAYVANTRGEESLRFYRIKGELVLDSVANPFIYQRGLGAVVQNFVPEFHPSQGSLNVFTEVNSDTVYRVDENLETRPYVVFNLGKYLYTRKERYNTTRDEVMRGGVKKNMMVLGEIGGKIFIRNAFEALHTVIFNDEYTYCYNKQAKEVRKYFLTYPENDLDILEGAAFVPRAIFENKYLVDWEQPDNEENPVLILVEP